MSYQIPPDIENRLKAHMSAGAYQSEDDVLRQATDALDQLEQDKLLRWHERNRSAVRQSERGRSKPLDPQPVLARLRKRVGEEGIEVTVRDLPHPF